MCKFCREWWEQYPVPYKGVTVAILGYGAVSAVVHLVAREMAKCL